VLITREELERVPLRYRWLLKLLLKFPNPSIFSKFPGIEGVFWAIVAPIFLILYFLTSVGMVAFLSLIFIFPFNIVLGLLIPGIIFVFFLRIQVERTLQMWRNIHTPIKNWDIAKTAEELLEIFKKQKANTDDAD